MDIDSDMVGGKLKMDDIKEFKGEYRWLSNFYISPIVYHNTVYPSVEHAFQAAKTLDELDREMIRKAKTPGDAKRLGRHVTLIEGWDDYRDVVMLVLLRFKFMHRELADKLIATGDARLIEGNHWGDIYWGVCRGIGKNRLGELLMQVRDEIKEG